MNRKKYIQSLRGHENGVQHIKINETNVSPTMKSNKFRIFLANPSSRIG